MTHVFQKRHIDTAERIIKREGLAFALAAGAGKEGDLREARQYLKIAICQALHTEFERGVILQRRSTETNAQIDELERDLALSSTQLSERDGGK